MLQFRLKFLRLCIYSKFFQFIKQKKSPYEGGKFKVEIHFPPEYPMKPPELKFQTKIYHPSVGSQDGAVGHEILGKNWAPTLNIFFSYFLFFLDPIDGFG